VQITEYVSYDNRVPVRDMNRRLPEYDAEAPVHLVATLSFT
jgi:hypothetical protein